MNKKLKTTKNEPTTTSQDTTTSSTNETNIIRAELDYQTRTKKVFAGIAIFFALTTATLIIIHYGATR